MIQQPKFWKNKNIFSDILLPFSYVYIILGKIRNFFEKNYKSNLLVICVGNFTIGGSGKTPTVIYISINFMSYSFLMPIALIQKIRVKRL